MFLGRAATGQFFRGASRPKAVLGAGSGIAVVALWFGSTSPTSGGAAACSSGGGSTGGGGAGVGSAAEGCSAASASSTSKPEPAQRRTQLLIVRHGETVWNAEGRVQGQLDIALNDVGREQARRVAEELRRLGITERVDAVVSSDLVRASETADAIAELCPRAIRLQDPGLREMTFGTLQGKLSTDKEVHACRSQVIAAWKDGSDIHRAFPEGESAADVVSRGMISLTAAAKMGSCVVVVAHGQLIKWCAIGMEVGEALESQPECAEAMKGARVQDIWKARVPNCCLSVVQYDHGSGRFIPEVWFQDVIGKEAKDDTG